MQSFKFIPFLVFGKNTGAGKFTPATGRMIPRQNARLNRVNKNAKLKIKKRTEIPKLSVRDIS